MDFITVLKEKVFKRYSTYVMLDEKTKEYKIVNYQYNDINDKFITDLQQDLLLPVNEKKFSFIFSTHEFKGFKNSSIQSFITTQPSMEDFDNVFHSFYKHIPVLDLFNSVAIKTDTFGNVLKESIYTPYILYFLKQDFSHQTLYPTEFLKTLSFKFLYSEKNYTDLKESLYSFVSQHIDMVRKKASFFENPEKNLDEVKKFEHTLYECVGKHINPNDMKLFDKFWPHILIKRNTNQIISPIENTFVFNLNFSYLSENFPVVANEIKARSMCHFINDFINKNISDYFNSSIIQEEPGFSKFVIEFHKNIQNKDVANILDTIIGIKVATEKFEDSYKLKEKYTEEFNNGLDLLKKELYYYNLNNRLPDQNIVEKKNKI